MARKPKAKVLTPPVEIVEKVQTNVTDKTPHKVNESIDISKMLHRINPHGVTEVVNRASMVGTPIFTINDLKTTQQPLALLVRLLFIQNNITKEKFEALHLKMAQETYMPTNRISYDKNNLLRSAIMPEITWNLFEKLMIVLGLNLQNITVTLQRMDTKEVFQISKDEVRELIKDNPYPPNIIVKRVDGVVNEAA